jgi:hypothetical protein
MSYYRYNTSIREQVRTCFTVPCQQLSDCLCEKQPVPHPWVAATGDAGPIGGC